MIHGLIAGAIAGAWLVGFITVVFTGMTILAGIVRLGRNISSEPGKGQG